MCKNCDSVQVCRLNFQKMSEQSVSFLQLKALSLAQEFRKIAEMTRHDLRLQVYFQLGCHLNHCNVSHCFLQLIFLTKRRTTQWVYEKTILQSQNLFKIPVLVHGFFVKNENNSLCPRLRLAAIFVQPTTC